MKKTKFIGFEKTIDYTVDYCIEELNKPSNADILTIIKQYGFECLDHMSQKQQRRWNEWINTSYSYHSGSSATASKGRVVNKIIGSNQDNNLK